MWLMYALLRPQMATALTTNKKTKVTSEKIAIQLMLSPPLAKIYLYIRIVF